jgi:hypothetical protein
MFSENLEPIRTFFDQTFRALEGKRLTARTKTARASAGGRAAAENMTAAERRARAIKANRASQAARRRAS